MSGPRSDDDREQALRRLLAEAVEPVRAAPGAQARLFARIRAGGARRQHFRLKVAGATLACVALIAGVAVFFAGRTGDATRSSTASIAGAPPSSEAAVSPEQPEATPFMAPGNTSAPDDKSVGSAAGGTASGVATEQDLDGDGRPDALTLQGNVLHAQLSRDGVQQVMLPDVGPGARVLGITALRSDPANPAATVAVAFIRLRADQGVTTDVVAAVVDQRLTLLRLGGSVAKLRIDAIGYGCDQQILFVQNGGTRVTPYEVSGDQLVSAKISGSFAGAFRGCVG